MSDTVSLYVAPMVHEVIMTPHHGSYRGGTTVTITLPLHTQALLSKMTTPAVIFGDNEDGSSHEQEDTEGRWATNVRLSGDLSKITLVTPPALHSSLTRLSNAPTKAPKQHVALRAWGSPRWSWRLLEVLGDLLPHLFLLSLPNVGAKVRSFRGEHMNSETS